MGLPATIAKTPVLATNALVLIYLNGLKMSSNGDYEVAGQYVRFSFSLKTGDRFTAVVLSSDHPMEFEIELPYKYDSWAWFDPSDPHDPKVKKIEEPAPTVTQL